MTALFHPLNVEAAQLPLLLNDPFDYRAHPIARQAAEQVRRHVDQLVAAGTDSSDAEACAVACDLKYGKMLGTLVCTDSDGRVGFLAAYSGQIGGRMDWPWFVPPVADYLSPDGYFRQGEAAVSEMTRTIAKLREEWHVDALTAQHEALTAAAAEATAHTTAITAAAKAWRDLQRSIAEALSATADTFKERPAKTEEQLLNDSRQMKRWGHDVRRHWRELVGESQRLLDEATATVAAAERERAAMSERLQQRLFEEFRFVDADGQSANLTAIFRDTPTGVPPSGAGECCAPRLLQYAFTHGLRPRLIAEFWYGESPRTQIRHDGEFYTACRGKCLPILTHMLRATATERKAPIEPPMPQLVYSDEWMAVIMKPKGLLSVPGRTGEPSVLSWARAAFPKATGPVIVHRLDQATSGLMVIALTDEAYHRLQEQFLKNTVRKTYVAQLERVPLHYEGTIDLPLRPDPIDRPRQVVDRQHGRRAITHYRLIRRNSDGTAVVALFPKTGRTHQLRMHCAHPDGLNAPIIGDTLYGHSAALLPLQLHAARLHLFHPVDGRPLSFK